MRERRLAGRARTDHAEDLAGVQLEADVLEDGPVESRRCGADTSQLNPTQWRRKRHLEALYRIMPKELLEPRKRFARSQRAAPLRDRLTDRRDRPPADDRDRDHHARRDHLLEREPRRWPGGRTARTGAACGSRSRMRPSGRRRGGACRPRCRGRTPAIDNRPGHRHRHHRLGVAPAFHRQTGGDFARGLAVPKQPLGPDLVQHGEQHHRARSGQSENAERPVNHKGDGEEDWRPRHVEEGGRSGAGHKLAHGREVAQRLVADVTAGLEPERDTISSVAGPRCGRAGRQRD